MKSPELDAWQSELLDVELPLELLSLEPVSDEVEPTPPELWPGMEAAVAALLLADALELSPMVMFNPVASSCQRNMFQDESYIDQMFLSKTKQSLMKLGRGTHLADST